MVTNAGNVVRLSGSGRDPAQRIINECRDRLTDELAQWLQGIGTDVAEELFVLADGTSDRLKQTQYLDLRRQVQNEWPDLVHAFRRSLLDNKGSSDVAMDVPDFDGLELVDDAELSQSIVIRELSARIAESCENELYGLDRRIALVMHQKETVESNHPLRPEGVCEALSAACTAFSSKADNQTMLLRRVERHLHSALPPIYHGLNAYLIDLGLLPDLKRSYRRTSRETAPVAPNPMNAALNAAFGPATGMQPGPAGEGGDFLGALQRLVSARSGEAVGASADAGAIPVFGGNPSGGLPIVGEINIPLPGTAMANSAPPPADAVLDAAALSQAFFASLEQFRSSEAGSTVNQIHHIRASEAGRQVGHVEAVTIDIVAMLFDFIFDDKELPDGVKSLVGRLQIPVLKLAMQDSSFFANRHHPARCFLDEISGIAIRWGGNVDVEDPFYCVLADLITRIQDSFESDVEIFSRALDELHQFVDSQTAVEDQAVQVATELATQRELEGKAWERAQTAVKSMDTESMLPLLRDFVQEHWLPVLQKLALEHEAESSAWQDGIQLVTDVAASIVPRKTSDERLMLIRSLPGLLGRINRGLDLVSTDKEARRPFFDALVDLHTAALKGESLSAPGLLTPAIPTAADLAPKPLETFEMISDPTYDTNSPAGDLIVTRSLNNGVEIEEITLVGAKPALRADDRDTARRVALLKRGDWVEFRQEDGPVVRERLTWISPRGRILVFSNHRAAKAISIAPEALAHLIRSNQAEIIEEDSLFERAMNGVLENLNVSA